MATKSGLIFAIALLAAGAGGGYWWLNNGQAAQEHVQAAPPPPPVQVAMAERKDLPVYLTGLGSVQAYNTVTVRTRVDGELQDVHFTEGQMVKQGDLLAQIDPRPYKAALDQATAKQAQDEALLANAKLLLNRASDLAKSGFGSTQDRDTALANLNQLTAAVQADAAAIADAQTQFDYTTIKSPLTGRTGLRLVDRGNIVHASDTTGLVEIVQLQPIAALFSLPEDDLQAVLKASKAGPVKVWAMTPDGKTDLAEGKLLLVDNEVDQQTGTVKLKASFDNADNTLWPGQSISGRILVDTLQNVVAVPPPAVQQGQNGPYAYVVGADNKVEARPLKVGETTESQEVVLSGLEPGEQVVTAGHYRLRPGTIVKILPSPEAEVAEKDSAQ